MANINNTPTVGGGDTVIDSPEADEVESTNKHLWNLLMGDSLLANEDVVHEELKRNCNKILSVLTFYPRRHPNTTEDSNVAGNVTSSETEKIATNLGSSGEGNKSDKPSSASNKEAEKKLRARLTKKLDVEESIAWEIFCSFMMFEYKGKATNYCKIMETELHVVSFLKDIWSFYMRERLCLIYCSQIILAEAMNTKNKYQEIFTAFVRSSSLESWVRWLCTSFEEVQDEEEVVALLHTLSILLFHYSDQDKVISSFVEHYKPLARHYKSQDILQAEAVLYYCVVQCGDPKSEYHNTCIEEFVELQLNTRMLRNPYTLGALISCLMLRFPDNNVVKARIKEVEYADRYVRSLIDLVIEYNKTSFKNKHGLSAMITRCVYNSVDIILRLLVKENFGTALDWYLLLSHLLRDTDMAEEFLNGNSTDIVNLYLEALIQFPVEISPILAIWGSICEAVSEASTCTAVLAKLTEIKYIAEIFDKVDPCDIRFHSDNDRLLLERRTIAGVLVKSGTVGTLIEESSPAIICWILQNPCTTTTVWDIIYEEIIIPALKIMKEGGPVTDITSELEYNILPSRQKYLILDTAEFLITFGRASRAIPPHLFELYRPVCFILSVLIRDSKNPATKADFAGLLLRLVDAGCKFNESLFSEFLTGIWPSQSEPNVCADLVIGYESVMDSNYSLSLGLLTATLGMVKENDVQQTPFSDSMKGFFTQSVLFIVENIFPAYRWVTATESSKNKIIALCLRIQHVLFLLKGSIWNTLKTRCIDVLIRKNSALVVILGKDEELFQDSIVKPSKDNEKLPELIHYCLSLLLQMVNYDNSVIKRLDTVLTLTLPQKVARFSRHRLNTKIPTLAIHLLGKIAQEINLSLLASFGNESDSFRDILMQRLEFKSEDIHLKIAILDFLNICVHMQNGLIEHFLLDENLVERLLELVNETDEDIQIASLAFVRALFRNGALVIKRVKRIWAMISEPIKHLHSNSNIKIATMTFNIYAFEIYNNGLTDGNFSRELSLVLQKSNMQKIVNLLMGSKESEDTLKCLAAFKHLLVIIFSKPEVSSQMPRETKSMLMKEVYDKFWKLNDETEASEHRLVLLSELMFQVCPNEDQQFLEDLASKMASSFHSNLVTVQISLLSVVNSCVKHSKDEINICTVDNLIKVISGIFFKSDHVFQSSEAERVFPLLSVAASTVSILISSERCVNVDRVYQRHHLASSIAHTAYMGITKEVGVQVVAECLNALIRMTMRPETCRMVQYCGLVKALWLPMSKFGDEVAKPSDKANAWQKIYSLCIYLNTCLLSTQKFYYLEDCLNLWSINGLWLTSKLWGLSELMNRSPLTNPEKNFKDLKDLLMFDVFVLNFISTMSPYLETWKKIQKCDVNQIIEGVFVTLRTTVGLLSQPNHLMLLISKTKSQPNFDFKLTPQLLEVQTKLWDVMALGVHIFCRLRLKSLDYVDMEQLHATMYSVGQLCVKALTKGDRRSHPSINVTQRIITTLEKSMSILYFINQYLRKHSEDMSAESTEMDTNEIKPQPLALRREMAAEVAMLCDSVRRLSIPKSEFLALLCASVETPFKINGELLVH